MQCRNESEQVRAALGAEASIGLTALYQARAGGNRAMISNAERYLVTNPDVSLKKRPACELTAPWLKDDTLRFLKSDNAPRIVRSNAGTEANFQSSSTYASTHGSVGDELLGDAIVPAWRKVVEQRAKTREEQLRAEREEDERMLRDRGWASLGKELERANIINQMRNKLNMDLLKVAESADVSFKNSNQAVDDEEHRSVCSYEAIEASARRAEALESLANGLSLSF